MKWTLITLVLVLSAVVSLTAVAESDHLAERGEAWQKILERNPFPFPERDVGVFYSLSQFGGKCQVHMIYDPVDSNALTFKFVRDNKELLSIRGHTLSAFRTDRNTLYFAHFPTSSSGCVVTAHDLATGEKLWETKLSAAGAFEHRFYRNVVTIGVVNPRDTEKEDEGTVVINGRETNGDYVEVLDRKTGKLLAHKAYKEGAR